MSPQARERVINNLMWISASVLLAVLVWVIATLQANPIEQTELEGLEVAVLLDDGVILTTALPSVNLSVRGQQSVISRLRGSDIEVVADLRGLGPASHTIQLRVDAAQPIIANPTPSELTVELAQEVGEQKRVELAVSERPPVNFEFDPLVADIVQAEVRGATELVEAVTSVRGFVDLTDRRAAFEATVNLIAIDEAGNQVENVEVLPAQTTVNVNVTPREDIIAITVVPLFELDTVSADSVFGGFTYDASDTGRRFLSGDPEILATIGDTIQTVSIDLESRNSDFEVTVPIDLPNDELRVLDANGGVIDPTIQVNVVILPRTTTQPYENVAVSLRNVPEGLAVANPPQSIFVLLDGPVAVLEDLVAADLVAVIDLLGEEQGTVEIAPRLVIRQGQIDPEDDNIMVDFVPENITITLVEPTPTAPGDATATPVPAATGPNGP